MIVTLPLLPKGSFKAAPSTFGETEENLRFIAALAGETDVDAAVSTMTLARTSENPHPVVRAMLAAACRLMHADARGSC